MSVIMSTMLDVSALGNQGQDVYTASPEAFKAEKHLAFRFDHFLPVWLLISGQDLIAICSNLYNRPKCCTSVL